MDVPHDHRYAIPDAAADGAVAIGLVGPTDVQLLQIAAGEAGFGNNGNTAFGVVLCFGDPGHPVATNVDDDTAYLGQHACFVVVVCQCLVDAGYQAQGTILPGNLFAVGLTLGNVVGDAQRADQRAIT